MKLRKVAGVIDRGGLEIRCTACPYRGFESLTFRFGRECYFRRELIKFTAFFLLLNTKRCLIDDIA